MTGVCRACGATARLGADGVCAWTSGCEHRQMQAAARGAMADAAEVAFQVVMDLSPLIQPAASHPYDDDLVAYHQRACEALGGPVCVHCVALRN